MNNAEELRTELANVFVDLKAQKLKPSEAAQFANLAGKMISSAKAQIEYYVMRNETPVIAFLATSGTVTKNRRKTP